MTDSVALSPSPSRRPPGLLPQAWRQLRRDLRAGELRLMLLSVVLAVAALTAVGFFSDRLQAALQRDALSLLGGDAVLVSDQPLPDSFRRTAAEMGLRSAQSASFPSMARASNAQGGGAKLVSLKSVEPGYPLRGRVEIADGPARPVRPGDGGPPRGTVWADAAVLEALGLKVGDALLLGDSTLRIGALLMAEPDRGAGFLSFAPRVMMAAGDLAATGLVQPASRVTWRLAVANAEAGARATAVGAYTSWAQETLDRQKIRGARIESLDNARPEMRQTLDRAGQFLQLVAVLAALLAAVAVGIAARGFAQRHLDTCAMLRVLGLAQWRIASLYGLELLGIGLIAGALGVATGLLVHQVFVWLLAGLVGSQLPAPGVWPGLLGMAVGLVLLAAFGLPPVLQLARVPPLRVLRRDLGDLRPTSLGVMLAGAAGYAGLLMTVAADLKLGGIALAGFALAWGLFALAAWLAVRLLRRWVPEVGARRWLLLATRQLGARPGVVVLQVSALALGLMALVLLVLIRTDLITSWRAATPASAPDRFVINILPEQTDEFRRTLAEAGVSGNDWYPMFRGRLVTVNERAVSPADYPAERAQRLVDREFNLSHATALPAHNELVGGRWVGEEADGLSVESGLAETLGLKLGDRLGFDVSGQTLSARITSLRKVNWSSMRVNFFVMFPRQQMADLPVTYITAFRAPARPGLDSALSARFPNVTVVDVSAQIRQVQGVLDQVIRAMEFLFAFTLAAGLLVLFAALTATRQERAREYALLRAMGAGSTLLAQVQRAELVGVGVLAGVLAALAASATGWALARFVFEFVWQPPWWVVPAGGLAGALLALAAGWWGLRGVLRQPVSVTLRQAGA
ncbi:putative ABC transport system permease protein [Sphaerotilus hippei]|uniref:Putative ABC transport system permease protein n=1 Tax=Sphaerotilus hippei TaxID=744406 RepID=A0A318H044_9BURK|nr:FtsX-like permease family protein [Sphaerotilus hippei]PXW96169.1 putative ABC transport system permease protein [Sphaerotilus hippei]